MADQEREPIKQPGFDSMLENSAPELPPNDTVQKVSPWRKAMNRILIGMGLSAITLNFWGLNYILPTIGILLALLGFRTLRGENGWFKGCWIFSSIRTACFLSSMILNTTIFHGTVYDSPASRVLAMIDLALLLLISLFLWKGLRFVQQKAELPAHAGSAIAMLVWYAALCLLAVLQYSGIMIALIMLIAYVLIIRSLFKLSGELDESGYAIQTTAVRAPDWAIITIALVALAVGMVCGYLFFNSYPMEWQSAEGSDEVEAVQIREHLIDLGFPKTILEDLTDEDIKACDEALRVVVNVSDHPANNGRSVVEHNGNTAHHYTVYDVEELRITGVGVELPGERERWQIFHHFLWTVDPGFYGTEAIQLWPAYRQGEVWEPAGDVTGRVLYDWDGQSYAAPYHSLGAETYTSTSILWGEQVSTDVFATFSMPHEGENHRGYLTYSIQKNQGDQDGWMVDAWVNYTHQTSWLQYPAMTAVEKRKLGSGTNAGAFITIQDALQFQSKKEIPEPAQQK